VHESEYSEGEQAPSQVTVSPAGVVTVPSLFRTEPFGTSQIWNMECGRQPVEEDVSKVSAAAGQVQAGIVIPFGAFAGSAEGD
jgi:hypothetical protein